MVGVWVAVFSRKHFMAYIAGTMALAIWGLSAAMNTWTGWEFASPISPVAGMVGMAFMLVVEFLAPIAMMHKLSNGGNINLLVKSAIAMAVLLSVISMWNGVAFGLTTHLVNMQVAQREVEIANTELEVNQLSGMAYSVTPQQSVTELEEKIEALYSPAAKNLAGTTLDRTVRDVTNSCTSGTYTTNPRLYRDTCRTIRKLEEQIQQVKETNAATVTNAGALAEVKAKSVEIQRNQLDKQVSADTTIPMVAMLVGEINVDCTSLTPAQCHTENTKTVKRVSSIISAYIAVFFEVAKNALVFLFLAIIIPSAHRKEVSRISVLDTVLIPFKLLGWIKERDVIRVKMEAEHKGRRIAELENETRLAAEVARNNVMLMDATTWMHNITFNQLDTTLNFDAYLQGKSVDKADVYLLSVLLCRQYAANTAIPVHSTCSTLITRAKTDDKFIKSITGAYDVPAADLVDIMLAIVKPYRMTSIIFPMFEAAGLMKSVKTGTGMGYSWVSDIETEKVFKVALAQLKQKAGNV